MTTWILSYTAVIFFTFVVWQTLERLFPNKKGRFLYKGKYW